MEKPFREAYSEAVFVSEKHVKNSVKYAKSIDREACI